MWRVRSAWLRMWQREAKSEVGSVEELEEITAAIIAREVLDDE